MDIICFGSAFDPLHIGHQAIIKSLESQYPSAQIFLVPTGRHPFGKTYRFSQSQRRDMLHPFCSERLQILDFEWERSEPSYTIDTLKYMKELYPGATLHWVLGSDQAMALGRWHAAEELGDYAKFILVPRAGITETQVKEYFQQQMLNKIQIQCLDFEQIDISSSQIRGQLETGIDSSHVLPSHVQAIVQGVAA